MKEFLISTFPIIPVVLAILIMSRKQKRWSELTAKEKKTRIGLLVVMSLLFIAGIVVAISY